MEPFDAAKPVKEKAKALKEEGGMYLAVLNMMTSMYVSVIQLSPHYTLCVLGTWHGGKPKEPEGLKILAFSFYFHHPRGE